MKNNMTKIDIIINITKLDSSFKEKQSALFTMPKKDLLKLLYKTRKNKAFKEEKEDKIVLKELVEKFGDKQVVVAIEELSELQKELCKHLRGKTVIENIIEEMADVYIMLSQMKMLFNIDNIEIEELIKEKIERTKERLL